MTEEQNENINSSNDENENLNSENKENENENSKNDQEENEKKDKLTPFEKQLLGRVKKAEEALQNLKANPPKQENESNKEYSGRIEKLELAALGETDADIIKLAKDVAKLENISLSDVKNSDYFKFQKTKIEEKKQIDAAAISPEDGSQPGQVQSNYKGKSVEDFLKNNDMGTEEGVKAFEKWKKDNGVTK